MLKCWNLTLPELDVTCLRRNKYLLPRQVYGTYMKLFFFLYTKGTGKNGPINIQSHRQSRYKLYEHPDF